MEELKQYIRDVPDYPSPGIVFRDITTLLGHPQAFARSADALAAPYAGAAIEFVVGIESRGFIFGALLASHFGCGLVPVRKAGKLPCATHAVEYVTEYSTDKIEIHNNAIPRGARVLIVDDLIATGGTLAATCELLEGLGAQIAGVACLIELCALKGRDRLKGYGLTSVIRY